MSILRPMVSDAPAMITLISFGMGISSSRMMPLRTKVFQEGAIPLNILSPNASKVRCVRRVWNRFGHC